MRPKTKPKDDHNGVEAVTREQALQHIVTCAAGKGVDKPVGAASSVFDQANTQLRRGLPAKLDLDTVEIRRGVALPQTRVTRADAYRRLLERMEVGDSVVLPKRAAMVLVAHAKERGLRVAYRTLDAENAGVWRLA